MSEGWILDESKREIFLVSAVDPRDPGRLCGMIITWISPASLVADRKRIMMALSPLNTTTQALLDSKSFAVHLLSQSQSSLVPLFGAESSKKVDKFESTPYTMVDGLPVVSDTCGWIIGNVSHTLDVGDRIIVVADVVKEESRAADLGAALCVKDLEALLTAEDAQLMQKRLEADVERDRSL